MRDLLSARPIGPTSDAAIQRTSTYICAYKCTISNRRPEILGEKVKEAEGFKIESMSIKVTTASICRRLAKH